MQRLATAKATLLATWLLALLFSSGAASQSMAWHIPHRGAHVYKRVTTQFQVAGPPSKFAPLVAIQDGKNPKPHQWRYFTCARAKVPKRFEHPSYDDSDWLLGQGGFGVDTASNKYQRTPWQSDVICARTTCDLGRNKPKALWFHIDHDDGVRIWLNGELLVADNGYGTNRSYFVTGKALAAWQRGQNHIAVKCTNTGGLQYLDVALKYFTKLPYKQRSAEDLKKAVREEQRAANRVRGALFGAYRPPPMLLQGELDAEQMFVGKSPADLREIAWWVAMDLRCGVLGGAVQLNANRMYELGDLRIRGRATSIDTDGWQTITATVKTTKTPAANKDSAVFMKQSVRRFVHHGFDGKLTLRRRIEIGPSGARVTNFESDLMGTITRGKDFKLVAGNLRQQEVWQLTKTHDNQDTAFRVMVKAAIENGTKQLRELLKTPKTTNLLKAERKNANRTYHSGRLAIGLLALIKSGLPKDDPVLVNCLNELRQRTLVDTYSLGNALMAIESYYQPATELSLLLSGSIDRPSKRQVQASDRALMTKWVERLLNNIDTRVDPQYLVRFNYAGGGGFDNSVHQYGLLGLYAAHLCGVEIQPSVWQAAATHLLDVQAEDGSKVALKLMDYRTHTRMQFNPETQITSAQMSNRANGWSYKNPRDNGVEAGIWGSMTCAGITGLAICQAALLDYEKVHPRKLQTQANRARHDGFAWLAKNMTVRYHPGALTRQRRWHYYYLYGLERASLLSGVALIQDRDWYFEGAMMLVLSQLEDGNWPGELTSDQQIERNAMAILFLKQSTSPVLTGK